MSPRRPAPPALSARVRRLSAAFLCSLLLAPPGMAEGLPDLGEPALQVLPLPLQKRIGQEVLNGFRETSEFIDDPEVTDYVTKLAQRLIQNLENPTQEFEFFVLRDSTLNAFAMPGGYIGVHSGLIVAAQSESELAGVLAHEISHVTQGHLARMFSKQSEAQLPVLLAMAVALLAARSNSSVGMGGIAAAQAFSIQNQLNYSRDYEREADRVGLGLLDRSGLDVRGMESFFERLQRYSRLYESNAPGYLRTHPLTTERIADMANRVGSRPYRQVPDSLNFLLVKARLRAGEGLPREAVVDFGVQIRDGRYANETVARYGLAQAELRNGNVAAAATQLSELRRLKAQSPMIETLAANVAQQQGNPDAAEKILRDAEARFPQYRFLDYALVESMQKAGRHDAALRELALDQQLWPGDARIVLLQSKSYGALGRQLQQHRALAEAYAMRGQLPEAIIQMQLAQKASDGNFFENSQVDARLRELKQFKAEQDKDKDKI